MFSFDYECCRNYSNLEKQEINHVQIPHIMDISLILTNLDTKIRT